MSLDKLVTYISEYRKRRIDAFNNKKRQGWFTTKSDKLGTLIDDTCSTKDANTEWEAIYLDNTATKNKTKLPGYRSEVAFVAGCRRDLRMMLASGPENNIRSVLDFDRFEAGRLALNDMILQKVQASIKDKQKGIA